MLEEAHLTKEICLVFSYLDFEPLPNLRGLQWSNIPPPHYSQVITSTFDKTELFGDSIRHTRSLSNDLLQAGIRKVPKQEINERNDKCKLNCLPAQRCSGFLSKAKNPPTTCQMGIEPPIIYLPPRFSC